MRSHDRIASCEGILARVGNEERLVQLIARNATRAETLRGSGALSSSEYELVLGNLFGSRSADHVAEFATRLHAYPRATVEPLEENPTRLALSELDCYLEREYPESYAGFRLAEHNTLVEFGFVSDLRERVAEVRQNVAFKPRVSGFAARFSLVELLYAEAMFKRAWTELQQQMPLKMWYLSVERNAFVVGVETDVATHQAALNARFGAAVVAEQSYGAAPA